jgi:ribosome-associated heat shock protein Hsp15
VDNIVRIDKWLWAVRLFKTRSLASEACRSGKVLINNLTIKPSREVKAGDIVVVNLGIYTKTVKVIGIIANRVSAKLVVNYVEDNTPAEEFEKLKSKNDDFFVKRERGAGRPTKKNRRDINESFPEW